MKLAKDVLQSILLILLVLSIVYHYRYQDEDNNYNWPLLLNGSYNSYEVVLHYNLMSSQVVPKKFTILDNLIFKHGAESKELTFEELTKAHDRQWKLNFDRRVDLVYPQAYNISSIIEELGQRQPIPEMPISGSRVRFLQVSEEVCHPEKPLSNRYDIVVIVKSGVSQFKERQEFRRLNEAFTNSQGRSVLGLRIGLVFSVGLPRSQQNNVFNRGEYVIKLKYGGGESLNPKDLNQTAVRFEEERKMCKDLIIGDYEDTYLNLTMKTFHSFVWASTFCKKNRPTILFIDVDVPVNLKYLTRVLRSLSRKESKHLLHGIRIRRGLVRRFGWNISDPRWNVLKTEVPWPFYSDFLSGCFILSSYSNVERLALGMFFTKQFTVDDAYIGLIASKLNISMQNLAELLSWRALLTKKMPDLASLLPKIFE